MGLRGLGFWVRVWPSEGFRAWVPYSIAGIRLMFLAVLAWGCYDGRVRLVVLVVRDDVILLSASFTHDLRCMSFFGLSSAILDT